MPNSTSLIAKNCESWTKGNRVTATRLEYGRQVDAVTAQRRAQEKGLRAVLSASRFRSPERVITVWIVTIREIPAYERHAQIHGYGVTGREETRKPNAKERYENVPTR